MDSDRVLVLDAGQVMEFDDPLTLINKEGGNFYSMAQSTGKEMYQTLKKMAELGAEKAKTAHYDSVEHEISLGQDGENEEASTNF
ncbi:hypothetical protein HDE_06326 [Halotydeus destructor]|nr:hypothetical protein HDE_06326 [Halotydeus destructor]